MKCFKCGEINPTLVEVFPCEIVSCSKEVGIGIDSDTNISVLCPLHQNQLTLVRSKLKRWKGLIEREVEEVD